MRIFKRILLGIVIVVLALVLFVVGSIAVDALIGRNRVAALVNTQIDNPNGPPVGAFVAQPAGAGPHPAVIMIHEFWGLKQEINDKATALAAEGYVVVAPDTYRGTTTGWLPRAIYLSATTPEERVMADLDAIFAWLAAQPNVDPQRIAVMGFCYGGRQALRYGLHNNQLAATSVFYGTPVSDPAQLSKFSGPVLGVFGGADTSIPLAEVEAFEAGLKTAGIPNQISIYPGQPHAFVTSIEAIRQGGAQGEAWAELLAFLQTNLKQ